MIQTRMDTVDYQSQVGERSSTGVSLSSVYAGSEAKVGKSVSIMGVSDGGLTLMKFKYDDGGRKAAGFTGSTGDCVCRAIAIATGKPYQEVYDSLNQLGKGMRQTKRVRGSSARTGVARPIYDKYLKGLGWEFVATMGIGTGCKVHLHDGELPSGTLICRLSRHLTAVIDEVIHDTFNPEREIAMFAPDRGQELKANQGRNQNGVFTIQRRCVYGYYRKLIC